MNLLSLILTAFGLSMDAFAVSITNGLRMKKRTNKNAAKIAIYMGGFQGLMPVIGWALGLGFKDYITSIDHWIALVLLSLIGGKMIYEAIQDKRHPEESCEEQEQGDDSSKESDDGVVSNKELLLLAIATSIDALAVGVSFAFLNISIISSASIIAIITFLMCFIGVKIGKKCGCFLKDKSEIIGGIILILIGLNIFLEHTNFLRLI
ncbi:MAG: manganese efflux pump MntP family protein [Clostridium sp.]|uniref:manganese efflux pump MntP n=1 Tax=Clostridium sp. TaxID=1506 RepID=UPI002A8EDCB0|nr:manganese efflux pump MntP family protein [Clostridium sp.]MDY5098388.1 manganese efflux pump MntP family protein [Clostridium sp.]